MGSVDVVVPSYQYGGFLRQCVTSVLTQGIADLRVLIIDNASSDDSVEVARQLAAGDARVEVRARQTNLGPHASFNDGIDWASADYFLILCADDLLVPGALPRAVAVLDRNPNVHLTWGAILSVPSTEPLPIVADCGGDGDWRIVAGATLLKRFCETGRNHVPGPTAVVRTSVQKRVGHYRRALVHTDDLEMWMRFARLGDAAETKAVQGLARTHSGNQSASVANIHTWNIAFEAAFVSFFAHEGHDLADARDLLRTARNALGGRAYWCALSHFCRGEPGIGLDLLRFAWRVSPTTALIPPITHLLRRADAAERIGSALRALLRRRWARGGCRAI